MGLAFFNRMRLMRVEEMKPENIAKEAKKEKEPEIVAEEKVETEEPVKEVLEEETKEEIVTRGSKRKK